MLIWAIYHKISNSEVLWSFCGFLRFWAAKTKPIYPLGNKPNLFDQRIAGCVLQKEIEKTKPICSYCVLRDVYCVIGIDKTTPILDETTFLVRKG